MRVSLRRAVFVNSHNVQEYGEIEGRCIRKLRAAENSLEANYRWNFYGRFNAVRFRSTASPHSVLFTVVDRRRVEDSEKMNKKEKAREETGGRERE